MQDVDDLRRRMPIPCRDSRLLTFQNAAIRPIHARQRLRTPGGLKLRSSRCAPVRKFCRTTRCQYFDTCNPWWQDSYSTEDHACLLPEVPQFLLRQDVHALTNAYSASCSPSIRQDGLHREVWHRAPVPGSVWCCVSCRGCAICNRAAMPLLFRQ